MKATANKLVPTKSPIWKKDFFSFWLDMKGGNEALNCNVIDSLVEALAKILIKMFLCTGCPQKSVHLQEGRSVHKRTIFWDTW